MKTYRAGRLTRPLLAMAAVLACLFITAGVGTSVAGIQGSGFRSYGRITQFGSIFVNGVEYDTSAANIRIDGEPGSESRLRVGHVVTVTGELNENGLSGTASEVTFSSDVSGPVAQVDLAGGTLVILGQRIRLLPDTVLDGALPLGGILGLLPGIKLQVSGFPNAAGELVASRIDLVVGGPATSRVKGIVQSLNTTTRTFRLNSQTVNYSDVAPSGTLANGSTVSVYGSIPPGQSSLRATQVDVISGLGGAGGELGDVEGLITVFNAASDFMMGVQRIATDANTQFFLHGKTLGPNLAVKVNGVFDAAGVLVARRVEVSSPGVMGVLGLVESVSASDQSIRVLGVNFTISDTTAFDDKSSQHLRRFALSDLRPGDYVEIRGAERQPDGAIRATLVEREDARSEFYVEGAALNPLVPTLNVLGVSVLTTLQTKFPTGGLLASLKFFLEAPNRIVRVRGTMSGNLMVAERIEFVRQ
jgi:hypothetical protein